jgi:glycosyltransferase involved in cell wall biosynthesis
MKQLTVIIPNKAGQTPELTIKTLYEQTFTDFDIIIINDLIGNANIARNSGLRLVYTPFVLFSDNDINWFPGALQLMMETLMNDSLISYAYGSYVMDNKKRCYNEFDPLELKRRNYISTMTIVRTAEHPGWDENIKRLQDWDVWLTMLAAGKVGKYVGENIFTTPVRDGITKGGIGWTEAVGAIRAKHGI